MITRDFIMRQIHQLVQVLARVLLHREKGQLVEADKLLNEALVLMPGVSLDDPGLTKNDVLQSSMSPDGLVAEKAVLLADLLWQRGLILDDRGDDEHADTAFRHAGWLYEAAAGTPGATLPLYIRARIEEIEARLGGGDDSLRER